MFTSGVLLSVSKGLLDRQGGCPVVHSRAVLQLSILHHTVFVRPLDGNRLRHVQDVPAAVTLGGLCDSNGLADHLAQKLRVGRGEAIAVAMEWEWVAVIVIVVWLFFLGGGGVERDWEGERWREGESGSEYREGV